MLDGAVCANKSYLILTAISFPIFRSNAALLGCVGFRDLNGPVDSLSTLTGVKKFCISLGTCFQLVGIFCIFCARFEFLHDL